MWRCAQRLVRVDRKKAKQRVDVGKSGAPIGFPIRLVRGGRARRYDPATFRVDFAWQRYADSAYRWQS